MTKRIQWSRNGFLFNQKSVSIDGSSYSLYNYPNGETINCVNVLRKGDDLEVSVTFGVYKSSRIASKKMRFISDYCKNIHTVDDLNVGYLASLCDDFQETCRDPKYVPSAPFIPRCFC